MITDAFDELARATSAAVGNRHAGDAVWIDAALAYRMWVNPKLFSLMHSRTATQLKDHTSATRVGRRLGQLRRHLQPPPE